MRDRTTSTLILITALLGMVAVTIFCAWWGPLNHDEGWYLYAARLFREGLRPYRDFFFTQGPVMPAAYGTLLPSGSGILAGRCLTSILGIGTIALTAWLLCLKKVNRHLALLLPILLLGANVYHAYFTTIPKTYALASLLLMGGFVSLEISKRSPPLATLSGLLLALAAGTRLSLGVTLPATGLWLLFLAIRPSKDRSLLIKQLLCFSLGGFVGLGLISGSAASWSWSVFLETQGFHGARAGTGIALVAGSLIRLAGAYLPLILLALALRKFRLSLEAICWISVFLIQLAAPFPYDDYQVPIMPLLLVGLATQLPAEITHQRATNLSLKLLIFCGLCAVTSPIVQQSFVHRQDRFWPILKAKSDLHTLRDVARQVAQLVPPDQELLTQDLYLAVEANRRVPKGFEMGPFSYFPDWSTERVTRCHLHNRETLSALIRTTKSPLAAISGYTFALTAPAMTPTPESEREALIQQLQSHYCPLTTIPNFGQHSTTLELLQRVDTP